MKFFTRLVLAGSLLVTAATAQTNPNRCGNSFLVEQLNATNPAFMQARQHRLLAEQLQAEQRAASGQLQKTAAQYAIPVAFHIVVSNSQYFQLGGDTGVIRRVNSQLASLNADYSATNSDISRVPTAFVPVIGNAGLSFRRASGTNGSTISPGVEIRKIPDSLTFSSGDGFASAKRTISGGLDGWDPTIQLNVWVIKTDQGILGLCIPPSYVGASFGIHTITSADLGVVLDYGAFGKREFVNQSFNPRTNDQGRTATHEIGHYFELAHIWGDASGCTPDDGIADTPPQDNYTYCSPTCPTFPKYDACSPSGNGIMFMNYMDYVDDASMMLFTKNQVTRMQSQTAAGGRSYSLTQQVPQAVVSVPESETTLTVFPNPNTGTATIQNLSGNKFTGISVQDLTGRTVLLVGDLPANSKSPIDLSVFGKGIYFLKATSGNAVFTQKIMVR